MEKSVYVLNKTSRAVSALILPSLLLTGCLLERDPYVPKDLAPKIEMESRSHLLRFKGGCTGLSQEDRLVLSRLYREFNPVDQVMVRIGVDHMPSFARSKKNLQRLETIKRYLYSLGINMSQIQVVDKAGMNKIDMCRDQVGLIVSFQRMTMTPPPPPCWDYRMDGNVPPEGEPGFGAANARNTAVLAADPNVLINAEEFGGSDGARSALSIENLRTAKVKKLRVEQVQDVAGGGAGAE